MAQIRGIERKQEVKSGTEWRDLRTRSEKFRDWITDGDGILQMAVMIVAVMAVFPVVAELLFVGGMLLFWWISRLQFSLPFRLPSAENLLDPNDIDLATKKPGKASGIAFLGNEIRTKRELWFKRSDISTHILVFGTTGAGKALPDNAPVHTPRGWVRMDQLSVGQRVSTPDGRSAAVVGVYPQGDLPLYALVLEDGRQVEASGDHLWAVRPHFPLGPLESATHPVALDGREETEEDEVIDTQELRRRLDLGLWPDGSRGYALPLTLPPEAPEHPEARDATGLASEALRSLLGQGAWPHVVAEGSRVQREAFWSAFWAALARHEGARNDLPDDSELDLRTPSSIQTAHLGRESRFMVQSVEAAEGLLFAARSMGWWASRAATPPGTLPAEGVEVIVRRNERGVRVLRVEPLRRSAPCRCIKIDDPRGLFLTRDWTVTHNTEALVSMAYNALVQGSGFIYIDGKGDNSLWGKIYSMSRSLGRDDDLLVINYMTGGRDVFGPQEIKLSNTINPFITGSSGGLTELMVSLMDEAGGDGAMWKGRAMALISAVMACLVFLRDNTGLLLDVDVIREHLVLDTIQKLAKRKDIPAAIITPVRAYLRSLPGYQENLPAGKAQSETAMEQHGYLQMQFTRILGSLSDTYGYIFRTNLGEVDFFDVVLNRRILVVLLPALEKSPDELGNLGKIIVASIKQMMATGLGDALEGRYQDIVTTKPTESPAPFMCILDEYGYYVVKGAAVMPAQARSLGFCMVFAGQDYPSFKKNNNAEEAAATVANCNIKIFMKTEDPNDTFELAKSSVGEANVSKTSGFVRKSGLMGSNHSDEDRVQIDRRSRIDLLDLKDQVEGEAHILFKSTLIRANMFFADPKYAEHLRVNYFLRVKPPEREHMVEVDRGVQEFTKNLLSGRHIENLDGIKLQPRLAMAQAALHNRLEAGCSVRDAALAGLVAIHRMSYTTLDSLSELSRGMSQHDDDDEDELDHVDAFGGSIDEDEETADDFESQGSEDPVYLDRSNTRQRMAEMEMATGLDPRTASARADAATEDIKILSSYPRKAPPPKDPDDLLGIIDDLDSSIDEGNGG